MSGPELAASIVSLVGGAANVERLTHCAVRLRFVLRDATLADDDALEALPDVVMVLRQSGQVQVALRTGVLAVHDDVAKLLAG